MNRNLFIKGGVGFLIMSLEVALTSGVFAQEQKRRDPFVALVGSDGRIKTFSELFPVIKEKPLSMNITIKAIIWDDTRPLALINNKIYPRGGQIAEGLIVEDIQPNSVTLNDNGNRVTVPLRKIEKK